MTYPAWTPASRPGIIPLHPLSFGTILGRSFSALRHNPRVLLGFALGVQLLAYLLLILGAGGAAWLSFSRLDTLRPGTDEYNAVMAGSIGVTIVVGVVLSLAVGALSAIVQGIVVREVAHAAVAEKPTLRALWSGFAAVAWRLVGYAFLLLAVVVVIVAIVAGAIFLLGVVSANAAVVLALTLLVVVASLPLYFWLSTKLLLAPAAIVLERATIRQAIARSWTLTRGRFWPAFGVIVLVSLIFATVAQVVGLPFSLLSVGFSTVIAPTGDPQAGGLVAIIVSGVVTQLVTLLVQAVGLVVQGTASALVYIDCRMRHEGLDLDLLQYVERRDAGIRDLADPYSAGIGRRLAPRPVVVPGSAPAPGLPAAYAGAPASASRPYGPPFADGTHPTPPPASAPYPAAPYAAQPPQPEAADPAPPAPTSWAAPGQPGADRERPWG